MNRKTNGWEYLGHKRWSDITREERVFCLHLYNRLQERKYLEAFFGAMAKGGNPLPFATDGDWEVGYEVCLFRDLKHAFGDLPSGFVDVETIPWKRTFDLCLFAADTIVLVEAKAQQGFTSDMAQLGAFEADKDLVRRLDGVKAVYLVAVASADALKRMGEASSAIDLQVSWIDLAHLMGEDGPDPILKRADEIFETGSTPNNDGFATGRTIFDTFHDDPGGCAIRWVGRKGLEAK